MKIEVMMVPVADVDRAKAFYLKLGWRLDADFNFPSFRVVQITPHCSMCSLQFGVNVTSAAPGSGKGYIIVSDIVAARNALIAAGVQVGEFFHLGPNGPPPGLDPQRLTYRSRAEFKDPDGNSWVLQEITNRLPGRVEPGPTSFASATDLASALKRAALALASTRHASDNATRTGPRGTPSTWCASSRVKNHPNKGYEKRFSKEFKNAL